jgi:hypothetical protein
MATVSTSGGRWSRWLLPLILFDLFMSLVIGATLGYLVNQIADNQEAASHNADVAKCWDTVLDDALNAIPRATLITEGRLCAKLNGVKVQVTVP